MLPDTKKHMKYIEEIADEYGVDLEFCIAIFDLLGESEMYDGFINAVQDMNDLIFE